LALLWLLQPARPAAAAVSGIIRTFPGAAPCNTTLQACINGSNAGDIDGQVRPQNGGFDIGYDEVWVTRLFLPLVKR
jgi:hypothetical protein